MDRKEIILVDEKDNQIGTGEKLQVHLKGRLHRAFSIFLFNSRGETLIQQRAKTKYHSAGLWSNSCCSHPGPDESLKQATQRRLKEELGIKRFLKEIFSFIYRVNLGNLIEYEFNHVFIGEFSGDPKPNKKEVQDWKWVTPRELKKDIRENPEKYSYWFKLILAKVLSSK